MSNERLRAAIDRAGLSVDELALKVQVDSKTVRRWISDTSTPRKTHRLRVAQTLNTTEPELWPEEELRVDGRNEQAEILAAYTHANDPATADWRALLTRASLSVDILDLTLADILEQSGTPKLLSERALAGCQVRLLLSAPQSAHLTLQDAELGHDLTLIDIPPSAQDANHSLTLLAPLIDTGVQARTFITARPNRILRFDDEMLIVLPLFGASQEQAPLLHLKRHSDHGLFQAFADQYERLWNASQPVASAAAVR